MKFDDGRVGYYVDHSDFYCDLEPEEEGVWSLFFRYKVEGKDIAWSEQMIQFNVWNEDEEREATPEEIMEHVRVIIVNEETARCEIQTDEGFACQF